MSVKIDRASIPRTYREYIDRLKDMGEAVEIDDEIDTHLEIGAVCRHSSETHAPSPVFNNITGTPEGEGWRACDIGYTKSRTPGKEWCRLAVMLGLPPETSLMDIQRAYIEAKEGDEVYDPVIVDAADAPCKQNKWTDDEVDINKIPAPLAHSGDAARYIGTAGVNIVRTPDESWTSWSINRAMIVNKNTMTGLWLPVQHNGMVHLEWGKEGKDTPWAMAFGVPPVALSQASAKSPDYTNEYDYASRILGEGIRMVKCETNDLLVPADSEIVLEGYVSKDQVESEGPFGEYQGYMPSASANRQRVTVTAVTYRDKPLFPLSIPGKPIDSCTVGMGFFMSGDVVVALQKEGLPVIDAMLTMESALTWLVVRVSNDWHQKTGMGMEEFVRKIGNTLWSQHVGGITTKMLVVNEDVDPDNVNDVTWAFATRNHPTKSTFTFPDLDEVGTGLEAYHSQSDFIHGSGLTAYSCLPLEEKTGQPLEPILTFETNYPDPVKQKILDNWSKWGFDK